MARGSWPRSLDRNSVLLAAALTAVGVLVVVVTVVEPPAAGTISFETRKLLVQFLLLVAGGGLITTWLDRLRERRSVAQLQREYRVQAVRSLIDGLDEMYTRVKLERRKLRTYPSNEYPRSTFEAVAITLSELQIEAELLKRNALALSPRVPSIAPLQPSFDAIDEYLTHIQGNAFEVLRLSAGDTTVDLASTGEGDIVLGFISGQVEPTSTSERFMGPYHDLRRNLVPLLGDTLSASDSRR